MWSQSEIADFIARGARAYAPGSVGNLSVGFDVLGMAINEPGDYVTAVPNDTGRVQIKEIICEGFELSKVTEENTAGMAAQSIVRQLGTDKGVDILLEKKMPLGSGMGSSAASAVAAAVATNAALEGGLSKWDLLEASLDGEQVASKARHGDNAFPCLLGGILLCRGTKRSEIVELPIPEGLCYSIVHPEIQVLTAEARKLMPNAYPRADAVHQMANLAGFVAGLYRSDFELMRNSLHDVIAEPYRKVNITGFDAAHEAAMDNGAIGFGISGSGPSVFAICQGEEKARLIADAIGSVFKAEGVAASEFSGKVNTTGAYLVN